MLAALSGWAGWVVWGGGYWRLMNPKYQWLTAAGAVLMLVLGLGALLFRRRSVKSSVTVALALILILALAATPRPGSTPTPQTAEEAWIDFNGTRYLKINPVELYLSLRDSDRLVGRDVVVRGQVKPSLVLAQNHQFALVRIWMLCCLADAVGLGVLVLDPSDSARPDGQWVRVFGRIEPLAAPAPPPAIHLPPAFFTTVNKNYQIRPDRVEAIEPPTPDFVYRISDQPPHHY